MGIRFSNCCKVDVNFSCTLCGERSSPEPEVAIELRSTDNEGKGMLFVAIIDLCIKVYLRMFYNFSSELILIKFISILPL